MNVAVVAPAATVTLAGTDAVVDLFDAIVTTVPPAGAAFVSVTVPVAFTVPTTEAGVTVKALRAAGAGVTVRAAVFVVPPYAAEIVRAVEDVTARLVMTKVALVDPAGIATLAGTVAAAVLLEVSVTTTPPAGAAAPSTAVPVALVPPGTEAGETVTALSVAAPDGAANLRMNASVPPWFAGWNAFTTGKSVARVVPTSTTSLPDRAIALPSSFESPPIIVENSKFVPVAFSFVTNASLAPVLTPLSWFTSGKS